MAATCAAIFLCGWIARFGIPSRVITDQGSQFTSALWREMASLLGISPVMTTAFHPQSNGMIERVHRTLKERLVLRSLGSLSGWMANLPLVLLGLRSTVREDTKCCPADIVIGCQLRLPRDLHDTSTTPTPDVVPFVADLLPVRRSARDRDNVPSALQKASHVFLRVDAVRRPLTPP